MLAPELSNICMHVSDTEDEMVPLVVRTSTLGEDLMLIKVSQIQIV